MGNTVLNLVRSIPIIGLVVPLIDAIRGDSDAAIADFGIAMNSTIVAAIALYGYAIGAPVGGMIGGMIGGTICAVIGIVAEADMAKTVHDPKLRTEMADFSVKPFLLNVCFGAVGGFTGGSLSGAIAKEVGWATFDQFISGGIRDLITNTFRQSYMKKFFTSITLGYVFSGLPKSINNGINNNNNNNVNLNYGNVGVASVTGLAKTMTDIVNNNGNSLQINGIIAGSKGVFMNQKQQRYFGIKDNTIIQAPVMSNNTIWIIRYDTYKNEANTLCLQTCKENGNRYLGSNDGKTLTILDKMDDSTIFTLEPSYDGSGFLCLKNKKYNKYIIASSKVNEGFTLIDKMNNYCFFDSQLNGSQIFGITNTLQIFEDINFGGNSKMCINSNNDLTKVGFNDIASSIIVYTGIWFAYKDENFQSEVYVRTRGNYNTLPNNDTLSSLRSIPDSNQFSNALIVLFEDVNYGGKMILCISGIEDLNIYGFNDKVSSIYVVNGTWVLYQDMDYSGNQYLIGPGGYPDISQIGIPDDTISSLQENSAFGDCILYQQTNFGGTNIRLGTQVNDITKLNLNSEASSMKITRGIWFCYNEINYKGNCYIENVGDYHNFPNNDQIASLRVYPNPVSIDEEKKEIKEEENVNDDPCYNGPLLIAFEDDNYNGNALIVNGGFVDLTTTNWNDKISSLYIINGTWIIYKDSYYNGKYVVLGPGGYENSNQIGLPNDSISSMQPGTMLGDCVLYQDINYGGQSLPAYGAVTNLSNVSFNATASSLKVNNGIWLLYSDSNFQGTSYIKEQGSYSSLPDNDTLSSLRCIPDSNMYSGPLIVSFVDINYCGGILIAIESKSSLIDYGWNDQISSLIVMGCSWVVYTDINYQGAMFIIPPGRYSDISKDLGIPNDSISSFRPMSTLGHITLYQDINYGGSLLNIADCIPALVNYNFNDKAASAKVRAGVWFMYKDTDYSDNASNYVLTKGDYTSLPINDDLSSVRSIPDNDMMNSNPFCVAFSEANYGGIMLYISGDIPNFVKINFNDVISSVYVVRGKWLFYEDINYNGNFTILGPGEYKYIGDGNNDKWSSVRNGDYLGQCTLYQDINYAGATKEILDQCSNLDNIGYNDRASSIKCSRGVWFLFKDFYYATLSQVITSPCNVPALENNDTLSSLRSIPDSNMLSQITSIISVSLLAIFGDVSYQGPLYVSVSQDVSSLERNGWFSFAKSLVIISVSADYSWTVYEQENYQGKSMELKAGFYPDVSKLIIGTLGSFKFNNK